MTLTVTEIGRLAGCSGATVSRALNNSGSVSPRKRRAIAEVMRQAQLLENRRQAKDAAGGARTTVEIIRHRHSPVEKVSMKNGVLEVGPLRDFPPTPQGLVNSSGRLGDSYCLRLIEGITAELSAWGCQTQLRLVNDLLDPRFLQEINDPSRDGILLFGEGSPDMGRFIEQCVHPIVLVDIMHAGTPDVVTTDNISGIRQAFDHLHGLGHRRIGYVGRRDDIPAFAERFDMFRLKMSEAGLPVRPEWIYNGSGCIEETSRGVHRILQMRQPERPTAFLCSNDCDALGVVRAAGSLGLRIPEQLSVVGFDDVDLASLTSPPLTTVHVPLQDLGRRGVRDLMIQMQRGILPAQRGCQIRLTPELVVRKSTGLCPAETA